MAPDDIQKGQWLVIIDEKMPELNINTDNEVPLMQSLMQPQMIQVPKLTGIPARVMAISLPFIAVKPALDPDSISVINIKTEVVRQASEEYVEAFKHHYNLQLALHKGTAERQPWV